MPRPTRFSPKVRGRAVRMVLQHQARARIPVGGRARKRQSSSLLPKKADLKKLWPEAEVDEWYGQMPIEFTGRFPKPDWWTE